MLLFCLPFLCTRMYLRVQGLLWECPRAGRFQATLLLRIIRMHSQWLGRFSGVAAYAQKQINKETAHQTYAFLTA